MNAGMACCDLNDPDDGMHNTCDTDGGGGGCSDVGLRAGAGIADGDTVLL